MKSLALPVILDRLSPGARSWIIAKSAQGGKDPAVLAEELIEAAAEKDGFVPPQNPASESTKAA